MAGERILVVDDSESSLRLFTVLLTAAGYEVEGAADASAALHSLEQQLPDLIIMDVQLPGVDGLTLTRRLKADARTRSIPILAVTAYAMKGDEERARFAGADGYLSKPIHTSDFRELVAKHLRR